MPNKKIFTFSAAVIIFLFFSASSASAQIAEEPLRIPGTTEGTGKHFEITDSEYLNIVLESNEDIPVRMESAPEMIVLDIKASSSASSANLVLSGFPANVTFHKYQDDYHNYAPLVVNENGVASFELDMIQDHFVFIQSRKSTKFIQDNSVGGNCNDIGSWNWALKTCILNQNVSETIQIDSNGITLDGNGHTVSGGSGNGIYVSGKRNIVIKNTTISNFSTGIRLNSSSNAIIQNNVIKNNNGTGLSLYNFRNSTIRDNIIGSGNATGIYDSYGNTNLYENNNIFSNGSGFLTHGSGSVLRGNQIESNQYEGLTFSVTGGMMSGNIMSGNGRSNFVSSASDMSTLTIDTSNTVEGKPIYYIKSAVDRVYDDSLDIGSFYCINCANITIKNVELARGRSQIFFWRTNNSLVENVSSPDNNIEVRLQYSSNNTIKANTIGGLVFYSNSTNNQIYNNNIVGDFQPVVDDGTVGNIFNLAKPVGGNYWGANKEDCVNINGDKFCDHSFYINSRYQDYFPLAEKFGSESPCCSSVMFLPGIKSSRLYKDGLLGEDKLWIPNYFGDDLENLALDENGKSIEDVYTRDVIDEVSIPVIGGNLYKSFIEDLASLKSDGKINNYNLFAYDWRQNVEKIVTEGTPYPAGDLKLAVAELEKLADASKNKKATIIAHSNGGLVAKALMQELERLGKADKVDKIIFVGTPQMGTPLAILSLLYGYDESALLGTLISRSDARELAENIPGAYVLMPSAKYFERMEGPFINFSADQVLQYKKFKDAYGENINSFEEFKKFLLGTDDDRMEPAKNDVEMENVLRNNFLDEASDTHERLDNWNPPANVEVIQIAGWGLDTVSGVDYKEKENVKCNAVPGSKIPSCTGIGTFKPIYDPTFTVDGDKVVVAPSALMLPEAEKVKKYWVDLYRSNKFFTIGKEHKDILELSVVRDFIDKVINNVDLSTSLPNYISTYRSEDYANAKPRLRMSLYSPLDIHLYDGAGRHTGPKTIVDGDGNEAIVFEEAIPNSYYYQFGDRKYVGFEGGENIRVEMDGYDSGAYALKLEEVGITATGEEIVSHTAFENLPTVAGAKVTFAIPETGIAEPLALKADLDKDGVNDYEVTSVPNGTVTLDATPPEIAITAPEDGEYPNNQFLTFAYSVTDNISELQNIQVGAFYDARALESGEEMDLSLQNLGAHRLTVSATDEAGNRAEKEVTFQIVTNIGTISRNVDHYFDLKLVADEKTRDFLQVKINELIHVQEMIVKMNGKNNENPKANQIKLLNKKIDDLVDFIQGKFGNLISSPVKEILIQSLNFVKM